MASFFDKLKNSMGIEAEEEKMEEEKEKEKPSARASADAKAFAGKSEGKQATKIPVKELDAKQEAHATQAPYNPVKNSTGYTGQEKPDDWFEPEGELAVDVYETEDEVIVQATIAGVNPDDLNISIENDVVTITGERTNTEEEEGKNYFYQECYWGAFSRQIILPSEVDGGRAEASMKNGVFTLRIPKIERKKLRKIKVRS